jgi:hypothetical protein
MLSKFQRWWLYSCFAAVLLAGWAGGFGVIFMLVFITIYLVGVALIGSEEPADEPDGSQVDEEDEETERELSNEQ